MSIYHDVLVPLDGSPFGEQAIATAAAIANASGAKLTLVRVHEVQSLDLGLRTPWDGVLCQHEKDYLTAAASAVLNTFHVTASTMLLDGPVVDTLCAYASASQNALIVMTTHGRTGFSRQRLGSVADGVLRHSTSPVLMLRAQEDHHDTTAGRPLLFRSIVVPLDGSTFAEQALWHATVIAEASSARLTLLHVVMPAIPPHIADPAAFVPPVEVPGVTTVALVEASDAYTSNLATEIRASHPALDVHPDVEVGYSPASVIIDTAKRVKSDLVVMATHGRASSRLVVARVADKVIRGGPNAVLLVRPSLTNAPSLPDVAAQRIA